MCRFVAYKGKPLLMAELLVKSANSLVFQSISSSQRAEPVNGDGFGVGWYPLHSDPEPGVFVSVEPAWSNRNLDELSKKIVTGCFFAHVRDATPGMPVTQLNCHPFKWENILFMHNGSLAGYRDERRRYLEVLSDAAFDLIQGNTDTEFCFAYFLDKLGFRERVAPEEIAYAMRATIEGLAALTDRFGHTGASSLNFAVTDGHTLAATRLSLNTDEAPETLYGSHGGDDGAPDVAGEAAGKAVIIASEPLDELDRNWTAIEPGHMVVALPDNSVSFTKIA